MGKNAIWFEQDGFRLRIKCGNWSCTRDGSQVPVGLVIGEFPEAENDTEREECRQEQARRAIRCNICVGGEKRRQWGSPAKYEPLANRADVRLLAQAQMVTNAKAQAEAAKKNADDRRVKSVEAYNREWQDYLSNREFTVQEHTEDHYSYTERLFKVVPVDGGNRWSDNYEVKCEASARYDDLPDPRLVRVTSTGSFTPKQARAIAKALIMMANRVENENLMIAPVNDKGEQIIKEA
jgi:hypothetical protein